MRDFEDSLSAHVPVKPAPALKERVLAATREELRRTWVDRLWTGPTWSALAALLLLSIGLLWASNRPSHVLRPLEAGQGPRKIPRRVPAPEPGPLPERWLLPFHYFPGAP